MGGPKADPDTVLMLAAQKGDQEAFGMLVERHRARVLRLAFRYLGDEAAAEDLAQEAFLRVYRARRSWKPRAKFSTWLYRVTANACLNELRSRKVRKPVETTAPPGPGGEGPPEGEDTRGEEPADALLRKEMQGRIREAVGDLPEDQRLAVLLSKFEGLSYRELADAMDRSVPAVKSLLVRARENLRRALEPYLGEAAGEGGDGDDPAPPSPAERRRAERRASREASRGAAPESPGLPLDEGGGL